MDRGNNSNLDMLELAEARLGRAVNPTLYRPNDFARKLAEDNAFLSRVLDQPKIFLIGAEDDIPKPGKSG